MAHLLQCWAQSVKSDNKEAPNKKSTQEVDDDGDSDIETAVTQGIANLLLNEIFLNSLCS